MTFKNFFYGFFNSFAKCFLAFQTLSRLFLTIYALYDSHIKLINLPEIFAIGFLNDLCFLVFALPVIYGGIFVVSKICSNKKVLYFIALSSFFFLNFLLLSNLSGEFFFWDEFNTRYNFIAVDYLIYTQEIIGTLIESVPLKPIIITLVLISGFITFIYRKSLRKQIDSISNRLNAKMGLVCLCLSYLVYNFYNPELLVRTPNSYIKELAKNGPYEFVYAFFNNELDYNKFYPTINSLEAKKIVKNQLLQPGEHYIKETSIERIIEGNSKLLKQVEKPNIVVIVVESLSAEYMGKFGNKSNLTPFLDKLAEESIFFTNLYATGTRTVRGLEAVTISIPPTPGTSILRRPGNENMFTAASVLKPLGYELDFVFGGYSYFDNMKYFYSNNGFKVTDRYDFAEDEISFANIWGIADEDAFKKLIKVIDQRHVSKKPFFSLLVTTTNHRPYTFPEGTINMPQGKRDSVVKYTDYAIESFITSAKKKPWFDNTIFVIVADHCASSAGKSKLPINKYHIPLFIYAPKLIMPQKIDYIASQIDVMPTILGLIGLNYNSNFYGMDALKTAPNRAFIGTYQLLGYLKNEYFVILSPKNTPQTYHIGDTKHPIKGQEELELEAISYYQNAYEFFKNEQHK